MSATSSSAAEPTEALVETVQSWFVDNFLDGETQLVGGPNTALEALDASYQVCGGLPSLQTRSSSVKPNGACPELFTEMNASCTCLSGLDEAEDTWEFRVRAKPSESSMTVYPWTQATTDALEIDAIQTLYVPNTLQKL
ncbi:hypothetical protein BBJ28_00014797 [Nothophytophthora sp. Chile5]|nr:hypothetical protein BBJ28_00014797 [Nothophytophthora sp. Chile5]